MTQTTEAVKKAELEALKRRAAQKQAQETDVRDARAPNPELPVPVQP